jgi:cell division protein FtsQ
VWVRRVVALGVLAAILFAAYALWLRDSALVAVRDVSVVGLSSEDSSSVRAELERAAAGMTTLHVREDELMAAVRDHPSVASIAAHPSFPGGLEIEVTEREPVALLSVDGRDLPVAGDGTVMPPTSAASQLPTLEGAEISSGRVGGDALEQARILGAAPPPLRSLIASSSHDAAGVQVELADGIELRFGDATEAAAKWSAASRILADGGLGSLSYIDLGTPKRPAVGGATAPPGTV